MSETHRHLLFHDAFGKQQNNCACVVNRSDPNVILAIEKCIMRGRPVLLENCEEYIDSMVTPIVHHRNTAHENEENEGALTAS